jgi:catechol 2,3-dioxygenase-like lactoylglutathione lyase family enzyme
MPLPPSDPRVRIKTTAFVVYRHAHVDKAVKFLDDFGMTLVEDRGNEKFYQGYGEEAFCYWFKSAAKGEQAGFGGAAYEVEERDELEKAAKVPGATSIKPLDAPGGGEIVTVKDPFGFYVHFVYGQKRQNLISRPLFKNHSVNYEFEGQKPRKGVFLRLEAGPAPVHKFGHYGFTYPEGKHDQVYDFYTK